MVFHTTLLSEGVTAMNKRGTTLIETIISIFIISVVLVLFLEALNVSITGTMILNRKTSALNLAKSQIEYVKAATYNPSVGDLGDVYALIIENEDIIDVVNYGITGQVTNVSTDQPLQQISVNVSYLPDKELQLIAYKTDDGALAVPAPRGLIVTDNVQNVPTLPQGYAGLCAGTYKGYYHIFTTGTEGPVSIHWKFDWNEVSSGWVDIGCPIIAVYEGVPDWASRDYLGAIREDGIIVRNQNEGFFSLVGIGDLPGPGDDSMCNCCHGALGPDDDSYCDGEANPIYWMPHHHYSFLCDGFDFWSPPTYPCCGLSDDGGEWFWLYDQPDSVTSGTAEDTLVTGNLSPGTYTVLFFNAENKNNLDTISASVTYIY